jgi:hypothetical protein
MPVPGAGPGLAPAFSAYAGGGRLRARHASPCGRVGKTESAAAMAGRMAALMRALATRRGFYADSARDQLRRKFRCRKLNSKGRGAGASWQ